MLNLKHTSLPSHLLILQTCHILVPISMQFAKYTDSRCAFSSHLSTYLQDLGLWGTMYSTSMYSLQIQLQVHSKVTMRTMFFFGDLLNE